MDRLPHSCLQLWRLHYKGDGLKPPVGHSKRGAVIHVGFIERWSKVKRRLTYLEEFDTTNCFVVAIVVIVILEQMKDIYHEY